jgi:hypothetical protein
VEGVAAVDLGAGRAAGGAAVVAADEELAGREAGRVEVVEDSADLAGGGVDAVLGAVAVEADRVGAAAEAGELAEDTRERALCGQVRDFRERGRSGASEDDVLLLTGSVGRNGPGAAGEWTRAAAPAAGSPEVRSAPVVFAEQGAQDYGGDGYGDGRDGDGGQERGEDDSADDEGDDGVAVEGHRRERALYGRRVGRGRGVGVRGRRGRVVGVLGQEHDGPFLIYSSSHVSRL